MLRDRLRLTILAAKVPATVVARAAGLPELTVRKILAGASVDVRVGTLVRLADALGCSTDWLLGRVAQGPTPIAVKFALARAGAPVGSPSTGPRDKRKGTARSVVIPSAPVPTDDQELSDDVGAADDDAPSRADGDPSGTYGGV